MACELTLDLSLSPSGDRVLLTSTTDFIDALDQFATRYFTQERLGRTVLAVDVEDFLEHLGLLSDWPSQDVTWSSSLEHLVRSNHRDAGELERQLESGELPEAEWIRPQGWTGPLTPFQLRDIRRLLTLTHGANFSVPGAGKTRVALAVFATRRQEGEVSRLLVVAPKSAYKSWQDENLECFSGNPLRMRLFTDRALDCDAIIVNYERTAQYTSQLAEWMAVAPTMMVADEGHRMKRGQAGVHGRAILSLAPLARHRLTMTGTPAPNGIVDLQNVMSFPWPGTGRALVQRATAGGNLAAASQTLKPLFVRTTKKDLNLPKCEPVIRPVELPRLHRRVYDALTGHFATQDPDLVQLGRIVMYLLMAADCPSLIPLGTTQYEPLNYMVPPLDPGRDPDLRELMRNLPSYEVSPKYLAATEIATRNAGLGRKTIIWSTFVRSLASLQLLMQPLRPAVVHGGTPDRDDQIKRFMNDDDCYVLLSNPATLGEGINLHRTSNDAVYVDRDFAAGRFLQSVDRIHRLGLPPDAEINVTVLAATQTIDEVVAERLRLKLRFMSDVLDDPDVKMLGDLDEAPDIAAGLSADDTQQILSHLRHVAG
jgi:SNF2 family DNA or RNA helicase